MRISYSTCETPFMDENQYAAIHGLALVFKGLVQLADSNLLSPVTVTLERYGHNSPQATVQPRMAVYGEQGELLVTCQDRSTQILYDESQALHYWDSCQGWWVPLPTTSTLELFQGMLTLWHIIQKGASLGLPTCRIPPTAQHGQLTVGLDVTPNLASLTNSQLMPPSASLAAVSGASQQPWDPCPCPAERIIASASPTCTAQLAVKKPGQCSAFSQCAAPQPCNPPREEAQTQPEVKRRKAKHLPLQCSRGTVMQEEGQQTEQQHTQHQLSPQVHTGASSPEHSPRCIAGQPVSKSCNQTQIGPQQVYRVLQHGLQFAQDVEHADGGCQGGMAGVHAGVVGAPEPDRQFAGVPLTVGEKGGVVIPQYSTGGPHVWPAVQTLDEAVQKQVQAPSLPLAATLRCGIPPEQVHNWG